MQISICYIFFLLYIIDIIIPINITINLNIPEKYIAIYTQEKKKISSK